MPSKKFNVKISHLIHSLGEILKKDGDVIPLMEIRCKSKGFPKPEIYRSPIEYITVEEVTYKTRTGRDQKKTKKKRKMAIIGSETVNYD